MSIASYGGGEVRSVQIAPGGDVARAMTKGYVKSLSYGEAPRQMSCFELAGLEDAGTCDTPPVDLFESGDGHSSTTRNCLVSRQAWTVKCQLNIPDPKCSSN